MEVDIELHPKEGELRPQKNPVGEDTTRQNALEHDLDESTLLNIRIDTVQYGVFEGQAAALIVLQFNFKFRPGRRRVRSFNVKVEFVNSQASSNSDLPKVESLAPEDGEGLIFDTDQSMQADPSMVGGSAKISTLNGWKQSSENGTDKVVAWDCIEGKRPASKGVIKKYKGVIVVRHQKEKSFQALFSLYAERGTFDVQKNIFQWSHLFSRKEKDDPVNFYPGKPIGPQYPNLGEFSQLDLQSIATGKITPSSMAEQSSVGKDVLPAKEREPALSKYGVVTTFRVTQIPAAFHAHELQHAINPADPDAIIVHSLIPDAEHRSIGSHQTATVTTKTLCDALRGINPEYPKSWSFQGIVDTSGVIRIDSRFLGLTVLASPSNGIAMDIIAVTGLNGHPFDSWRDRNSPFMWLRDGLHQTSSRTRIMTYGYDTKLANSISYANLSNYGKSFLEEINLARSNDEEILRPLVLIGHSLGGLLIKEALVSASRSDSAVKNVLTALHGLIFLGVPHRGLVNDHLMAMVEGQPNERFIQSLEPESAYLTTLHESFEHAVGQKSITVHSWYETAESKTTMKVGNEWKREGPPARLVSQSSATYALPTERASDRYPMNRTHSDMAKLEEGNPYLKQLQGQLRTLEMTSSAGL